MLLLVAYAAAYARYFDFGGDVAWGDRFVLLPVQLLCLFSVPLLMNHGRRALRLVLFASIVLQCASTAIAPNVEVIQRSAGLRGGVLLNRAINFERIATDREDPRRFAGIPVEWRSLSYFPFQLRLRFPRLATWGIAGWWVLLLLAPGLILALLSQARREEFTIQSARAAA
jgi:hypothetical protein